MSKENDFTKNIAEYNVASDAVANGNPTKYQLELVKKAREADNKHIKELLKDKEEYLIEDRSGNAFKFALDGDSQITVTLSTGETVLFKDYVEQEIWKKENKNITIQVIGEVKHEIWTDDYMKKSDKPIIKEMLHEYNIIEVCCVERFVSVTKE